jgi:negative regulator of sigma E activity
VTLGRALGVVVVLASGLAQAQSPEALGWLRKIQDATQKLSYRGTFVYQHSGRSETSRITKAAWSRWTAAPPSAISRRCCRNA